MKVSFAARGRVHVCIELSGSAALLSGRARCDLFAPAGGGFLGDENLAEHAHFVRPFVARFQVVVVARLKPWAKQNSSIV